MLHKVWLWNLKWSHLLQPARLADVPGSLAPLSPPLPPETADPDTSAFLPHFLPLEWCMVWVWKHEAVWGCAGTHKYTYFYCSGSILLSLVPRLSTHTTTTKSKEGESLVAFHTWCHGTNVTDISIGKFRHHSCADHPFSYLRVKSLGQLKQKERPGYAVDGARQFAGTNFHHRSLERVSCILVKTCITGYSIDVIAFFFTHANRNNNMDTIPNDTSLYKYIEKTYNRKLRAATRHYISMAQKIATQKQQLTFNHRCKDYGLHPPSLRVRPLVNTNTGRKIARRASGQFLCARISENATSICHLDRPIFSEEAAGVCPPSRTRWCLTTSKG